MRDPFRKGTDSTGQHQVAELEALIAQSREERAALSTMLAQVHVHSARVSTRSHDGGEVPEAGRESQLFEALEHLRTEIAETQAALRGSMAEVERINAAVEQRSAETAQLARELARLHEEFQHIRRAAATAAEAVPAIEERIDALEHRGVTLDSVTAKLAAAERDDDRIAQVVAATQDLERRLRHIESAERGPSATIRAAAVEGQSAQASVRNAGDKPDPDRRTTAVTAVVAALEDVRHRLDAIRERQPGPLAGTENAAKLAAMLKEAELAIQAASHLD